MGCVEKAEIATNARRAGFRRLKIQHLRETILELDFSYDLV